jgi:diacylglycerol kinase family enzyme
MWQKKEKQVKVSVVINLGAGSVNPDLIERKVSHSLFRCDLRFKRTHCFDDMELFLREQIADRTDYVMVCGGDGTVNGALQVLMKLKTDFEFIPPLCIVCSGTANDLANEIGVNERVDQAARHLLEGKIKNIDIIEITSNQTKKYMLTGGGVGLPALAADKANKLRLFIKKSMSHSQSFGRISYFAKLGDKTLRRLGSNVYSLALASAMKDWDSSSWEVEISIFHDMKRKKVIRTQAPIILVSNQPTLGKNFVPAPYTNNSDGLMNLLVVEAKDVLSQFAQIYRATRGVELNQTQNKSYEIPYLELRSAKKNLTFFGDGEILFKDVFELQVRCFRQSISMVVPAGQE